MAKKIGVGEPCHFCLRPITQKVLADKHARKVQNALNSVAKMKAKGLPWTGGRKRTPGRYEEIKKLRATGLSMRDIAKRVGVSTTVVQRALKN